MLISATEPLAVAEARKRGYTLAVAECADLLAVGERVVQRMFRAPADDAAHLPSVVVRVRGPAARRARLTDVEEFTARLRLPPPGELMRPGDAIEVLAGRKLGTGPAYERHRQRLEAAARDGRLTEYAIPGVRHHRYRRSEVQALKAALDTEGITFRRTTRSRAVLAAAKRAEALGLVCSAVVSTMTGADESTVTGWGRRGLYGARRIGGRWFFDPAEVKGRPARAKKQPPIEVECACCGGWFKRCASEVRHKRELAAAAGREPQFFCSRCWASGEAFGLRHVGNYRSWGPSERASAAVQAQWDTGARDREAAAERIRRSVDRLCKSPKRRVAWQEARLRARHGRGLTDEERGQHSSDALSRAQRASDRSRAARAHERRLTEMWELGKTVSQIADELRTTSSNVKEMRRRLALPPRKPGRPPRK